MRRDSTSGLAVGKATSTTATGASTTSTAAKAGTNMVVAGTAMRAVAGIGTIVGNFAIGTHGGVSEMDNTDDWRDIRARLASVEIQLTAMTKTVDGQASSINMLLERMHTIYDVLDGICIWADKTSFDHIGDAIRDALRGAPKS
jgi:hypothetical protein